MKAIHRFRILRFVKLSDKQKMFLDFKKWVKSIQTMVMMARVWYFKDLKQDAHNKNQK